MHERIISRITINLQQFLCVCMCTSVLQFILYAIAFFLFSFFSVNHQQTNFCSTYKFHLHLGFLTLHKHQTMWYFTSFTYYDCTKNGLNISTQIRGNAFNQKSEKNEKSNIISNRMQVKI